MSIHRFLLCLLAIGTVLGVPAGRADAPYVILDSGRRVSGVSVSATEDGRIQLQTETGVMMFEKGTRVVTARPRELDQAVQFMQQRQFARAAVVLHAVEQAHRFLGWDQEALKLLARAYAADDRAADAVSAYERLFAADPQTRKDADDFLRYLKALDADGQETPLATMLDEVVRSAPRAAAAWAQLRRGRIAFEQEDVKAALLDFKRTADLFQDQEAFRAEALYRTAVALYVLRDQAADRYAETLRTRYPASPYAGKPLK